MPELAPRDQASLDGFVSDLSSLYGERLHAVALTGEAASEAYRPRRTPLTTVVVIDEVSAAALREARPRLRAWRRRRIPTPLFLDPLYVETSLDTFPLEFLEIMSHHVLLHGVRDPFAALEIDVEQLRLQVEEQLRGKLLHLWEAYLEAGSRKSNLERLLLESLPGFEMVLRGLLRLEGQAPAKPASGTRLVEAVSARLGVPLPTFLAIEAARTSGQGIASPDLEPRFAGVLEELRALVRAIDGLATGSPS